MVRAEVLIDEVWSEGMSGRVWLARGRFYNVLQVHLQGVTVEDGSFADEPKTIAHEKAIAVLRIPVSDRSLRSRHCVRGTAPA